MLHTLPSHCLAFAIFMLAAYQIIYYLGLRTEHIQRLIRARRCYAAFCHIVYMLFFLCLLRVAALEHMRYAATLRCLLYFYDAYAAAYDAYYFDVIFDISRRH